MRKDILVNIGVAAVSAMTMLVVRRKIKDLVERRRAELEMIEEVDA